MKREHQITIATRKSPLALWQARHVRDQLLAEAPGLCVTLLPVVTAGDRLAATPEAQPENGKALFVKALEDRLLRGEADIAVHSMKDVATELPSGLDVPVLLTRAASSDVLICRPGVSLSDAPSPLDALPARARVGTSSLRRSRQLLAARPDLQPSDVRGNVDTRISKLDAGQYDALVLAEAGLVRLGLQGRILAPLSDALCLSAPGQGAIGIECRSGDEQVLSRIRFLHHARTAACITAERAFSHRLGGGCRLPVAACAKVEQGQLCLRGRVIAVRGRQMVQGIEQGGMATARELGVRLAERLLSMGAETILREAQQG